MSDDSAGRAVVCGQSKIQRARALIPQVQSSVPVILTLYYVEFDFNVVVARHGPAGVQLIVCGFGASGCVPAIAGGHHNRPGGMSGDKGIDCRLHSARAIVRSRFWPKLIFTTAGLPFAATLKMKSRALMRVTLSPSSCPGTVACRTTTIDASGAIPT